MAVIIYGTREYGLVDEYQGEHASTTFFHIWFAPIFPVGSTWITRSVGEREGHKIKLHGKSIAAAYLRVWGPIVALLGFLASENGSHGYAALGTLALALSAWSWRWSKLRGDRAKRRSDFNYVAFGTRAEPSRLLAATRTELRVSLDRSWNARAPKGSPNDVAQHGTSDPAEAVLAYGLLRLAALERRAKGDEDADADRILDGDHVPVAIADGPYRAATLGAPSSATALGDLVAARAAADARDKAAPANVEAMDVAKAERVAATRKKRRNYQIGLAVATFLTVSTTIAFVDAMKPELDVTVTQMRSMLPPTSRFVRVECDHIVGPLWEETDNKGRVESRIAMCELGPYHLAVKFDDDDTIPTKVVRGELKNIYESAIWVKEGLRMEPEIDAATLEVFVDADSSRGAMIAIGLLFLLGTPLAYLFYFRWARKNREWLITS